MITLLSALISLNFSPFPPDSTMPANGRVVDSDGAPIAGAWVTATLSATHSVTVYADGEGNFRFPADIDLSGATLSAWSVGYEPSSVNSAADPVSIALTASEDWRSMAPASEYLSNLQDGETKRAFALDCTGCHQFNYRNVTPGGQPRPYEQWLQRSQQMVQFFGANSGFPIIAPSRDPEDTAFWLTSMLDGGLDISRGPTVSDGALGAVITEYDFPMAADLPHDLMVDRDGRVVVTGMFSAAMFVLEPGSGEWDRIAIPIPQPTPRALDISADGRWWVVMGAANKIAVYDPDDASWNDWDVGAYAHSVMLDSEGKVWFNDHFSEPHEFGYLDPRSGDVVKTTVSNRGLRPDGSPISYGLRVDQTDRVWITELRGNRLIAFDQQTGETDIYVMPTTVSGPRRPDVAPDGRIWIPEYAAGKLAVFDPETEQFTEYDFPIRDALPYVVRIDQNRGTVWIGTGGADAMVSFQPDTEEWTVYPLPTRTALIRHIDINEETGEVWGAYGDSPAVHPKIVRIQP